VTGAVNWPALIASALAALASIAGVTENHSRGLEEQRGAAAVMVVETLTGSIEQLVAEREALRAELAQAKEATACP